MSKPTMLNRVFRSSRRALFLPGGVLLFVSLFGSLAGCGAKLDPDVMERNQLPSVRQEVYRTTFSATLVSEAGDPIPGAKVVSQTTQGRWEDITTIDGTFRLEAIVKAGEPIEFHFTPAKEKRNPANVQWTVRVYDHELPTGVSRVKLQFIMASSGVIRLGSVEY